MVHERAGLADRIARAFARPEENRRHAALAEQAHQPECADALADEVFREARFFGQSRRVLADRCVEKAAVGVVGCVEQTFECAAFFVIGDMGVQPCAARCRRKVDDRIEQIGYVARNERVTFNRSRSRKSAGRTPPPKREGQRRVTYLPIIRMVNVPGIAAPLPARPPPAGGGGAGPRSSAIVKM